MSKRSRIALLATAASLAAIVGAAPATAAAPNPTLQSANETSGASGASSLASLRSALGLPTSQLASLDLSGCALPPSAFDPTNPFPGQPDLLVAALAPQATAYSGCLQPQSNGYQPPASDHLYGFPADGQTGVGVGQPLLAFASGPWVDTTFDGAYAQFGTSVEAVSLLRVRDSQPVSLRTSVQGFLTPGIGFYPIVPLDPGTSYRASVTLLAGVVAHTLTWTFQTSGQTQVKGDTLDSPNGTLDSTAPVSPAANRLSVSGDTIRLHLSKPGLATLYLYQQGTAGIWALRHVNLRGQAKLSLKTLFGTLPSGSYLLLVHIPSDGAQIRFTVR